MKVTTRKNIQVTDESEVYNDLEFSKPADTLVEAIKQQLVRIDGVEPVASRIKEIAYQIIDRRVNND